MMNESTDSYPLSSQQRRVWLAQEEGHVPPAQCSIALDGPLDPGVLHCALLATVARHDILRTYFRNIEGLVFPVQVVQPAADLAWKQIDCSEDDLDDLWTAERENYAFESSPVCACLARVAPNRHVLMIAVSPLFADVETFFNLARELSGTVRGDADTLQYSQFSAWQDSLLDRDDAEEGFEFWRGQVSKASKDAARFPFETSGAATNRAHVGSHLLALGQAATGNVRSLARRKNVPEEAVLLAAWQELVRRWTQADSHTMWVAVSGREHELLEPAFGPIAALVPVTSHSTRDTDFRAAISQAGDALLSACDWSMFYRPDRDPSAVRSDVRSSFAYAEAPGTMSAWGVSFSIGRAVHFAENVDLSLTCIAHADSIGLDLEYNSDRIAAPYAEAALYGLRSFIEHLAGAESTSISTTSTVQGEREGNDGLLHRLFEEQAARVPNRIALVHAQEHVTFAQLNQRANQVANYLLTLGAGPEKPIAVFLERSCDMLAAILGILKCGAAYVPIDPTYPVKRIRHILHQSDVSAVITHTRLLEALPMSDKPIVCLDANLGLEKSAGSNPEVRCHADNIAYVIYTSGSTGSPKGVMVSHRSAVNLLSALRNRLYDGTTEPRRIAMNAPVVFDASVKQWIQLVDGHTLCIVPEQARMNPDDLAMFLSDQNVDVLDCTPSQLRLLLECQTFQETAAARFVLVGGEAVDARLWSLLARDTRRTYFNVYGPTECTVDATAAQVTDDQQPNIGRPLDNVTIHVLDANLEEQPDGFAGELYIGGAGVARGYRNQPALTAERFLPDPFSGAPGARMYRTGDLVCRLADGQLKFLGRVDSQVKLRGHRIEPGEIEFVLKQADNVRDAVVTLRECGRKSEKRLVAYVVPQAGTSLHGDNMQAHLREQLPPYMIPTAFVSLPKFPVTTNGKVDLRALPEPAEETDRTCEAYSPPANQNERLIAKIWQDVLGCQKLGVHDNFFDLGGHSLLMVQVYTRLRDAFDKEISMVDLFRNPTIALLSRYFDGAAKPADASEGTNDRAARRIAAVAHAPARAARRP